MEANIVNIQTLFGDQVSFQIPQFQRPYAWAQNDQWMPLWADVRNVAERHLNLNGTGRVKPHFLGAIVLQHRESKTGEVTKRLVVDGQQRLTTLQLLMKAVQRAFQHADDTDRADRLRSLTENQDSHLGNENDRNDNQTKVRQSNLNDRDAFREAIRDTSINEYGGNMPITKAFKYFDNEVKIWLEDGSHARIMKAEALEDALTKHILIAVIDLDEDERPHLIFETLNARGEPLKQSDLVKNTVMYEAGVVDDAHAADRLWGMFNDSWWRDPTGEPRTDRIQLDRFLNHWMIMRTRQSVPPNRTASEFRKFLEHENFHPSMPVGINKVADDIKGTGKIYKNILEVEVKDPDHEVFFKRMRVLDIAAIMPVLLHLKTTNMPIERLNRCFQILESYIIRRMLNRNSIGTIGDITSSLLKNLHEEQKHQCPDVTIVNYLDSLTSVNTVWPNDRMLLEALEQRPMAGTVARRKMVLEAIELDLRGDRAEPLGTTDKLTLEHIMPQRWETHYPLPPGKTSQEVTEERNDAVKYLGNLTLTTNKLNASLSNSPWDEKRKTLHKHSSLFLNKDLVDNVYHKDWDEEEIYSRTTYLAKIILDIWKPAEYFMNASR